ncbi:MAG: transglutaminase family protein [Novosphingobium sp.]|nr:transglutaminase family protein [Novosphingobium sp.]
MQPLPVSGPPTAASASPTAIINSDHPAVHAFAAQAAAGCTDDRMAAVAIYHAVRDGIRYDPYTVDLSVAGLGASGALQLGRGWCIPKAALMAACCRAVGIPARVGLADVRNHLSTKKLLDMLGTDIFYCHGYTSVWLDGRWVKATPAFNKELCTRAGIAPLEFDGREDSINHPFDLSGQRHMEYLAMHGEFDDVPRDYVLVTFARHYPSLKQLPGSDWDRDIGEEFAAS